VGVGAGNVIAGLLGAFPVDASPPRTALVSLAGGKSQVAGLGAATALAALIPASDLLSDVPLAALAAVLVFVAGRIFRWRELLRVARFDVFEFALALLTLVTVPLVGVEQGIGVAVALAVLDRARRAARPKLHVLGRIPGTTSWTPLGSVDGAAGVPNVLVVLFATPLWYANADHFRREVLSALAAAEPSPKALVLDAIGMSDIDYTGAAALEEVLDELEDRGVVIAVARAGSVLKEGLVRAGLLNRIGNQRLFASVNEAVVAISPI
jgi:SulP family sulfate permease